MCLERKLKVQILPSNRILELKVHPHESIDQIRKRLMEQYNINNPEIRLKRGDLIVAIPSDIKVEDIPQDAMLIVSTYTDVGIYRSTFEEEARLLKDEFGWIKIGDTRLLYPYATTFDGLPIAIYVKKSLNFPREPPVIYLIPLSRFNARDHLKLKPECCFEESLPKEELELIKLYLYEFNVNIYPKGICKVHIEKWDS